MQQIALFEKVSYQQFFDDTRGIIPDESLVPAAYASASIPVRATAGSAGYDFVTPVDFSLHKGYAFTIPTGIRVDIKPGWFLMVVPRSGLGFKYQVGLANTAGIIDSDYYDADNEGHIFIKLVNRGEMSLKFKAGDKIAQGIFLPYGVTINDNAKDKRFGGLGSTGESV